jgi:hypothetical protein
MVFSLLHLDNLRTPAFLNGTVPCIYLSICRLSSDQNERRVNVAPVSLLPDHLSVSALLMADASHSKGPEHAHWTIEEEQALILFLTQHKAEAGCHDLS